MSYARHVRPLSSKVLPYAGTYQASVIIIAALKGGRARFMKEHQIRPCLSKLEGKLAVGTSEKDDVSTAFAGLAAKGIFTQLNKLQLWLWNRPYLLLTLAASLWASNFILGRSMPLQISPVGMSFWRWTLAIPFMLPFAWRHVLSDRASLARHWPILFMYAAFGVAGSNTLAYFALRRTSATSALLVQSAIPLAIVAFGFLIFKERAARSQLQAIAFALVGVLCVIAGQPGANGTFNAGTLLAVAAMLCQSLYAATLRLRPKLHPTTFLFSIFVAASVLLLPFQLAIGSSLPIFGTQAFAGLIYLAVGPSFLAFFLFNRGVTLIGANRAALFFYLMPVFGTIFAAVLLGERIGYAQCFGFLLVGAGFVLSRKASPVRRPTESATA